VKKFQNLLLYSLILLTFGFPVKVSAQENIPLGSWRTHLSYRQAQHLAVAGHRIFCATPNSLFYLDREDNSVNPLTRSHGLSQMDFSTIAWNPHSSQLLIGYQNGNLDILQEQSVTNFDIIKNSTIAASKTIRHISFLNSTAYLSTPFGVVVLDLGNYQARETYQNLGPQGQVLSVSGSAVYQDSLFLATQQGIIAGALTKGDNLMDFNNWHRFGAEDNLPLEAFHHTSASESGLFAATDQEIYFYQNGSWLKIHEVSSQIRSLTAEGKQLLFTTSDAGLYSWQNQSGIQKITLPENASPHVAATSTEGDLWIADNANGLLSYRQGNFEYIIPNGPLANQFQKLYSVQNKLLALPKETEGFSIFEQGQWKNITGKDFPELKNIRFNDVVFNLLNEKYYFATQENGLMEWDGDQNFHFYRSQDAGVTLEHDGLSYLSLDANGNLWMIYAQGQKSLHQLTSQGEWKSYSLGLSSSTEINNLLADAYGNVWMTLSDISQPGLLAFNPESRAIKEFSSTNTSGDGLPSKHIYKLTLDYEGMLWLTTDDGVAYLPYPSSVFEENSTSVITPIYNQYPLLRDQEVYSIQVDGGNRKWMGTGQDLWLFNDLGEESIAHFTVENSILPSEKVLELAITETNGELFIATDNGMVSYRSGATRGQDLHQQVKIFPNPVPPAFDGQVGISGLANDAIVKITDAAGNLIRELQAQGSTTNWDVKNEFGQKVQSGIYLVFSATEDGEDTYVGKIAVVE
jgi:ligand-binding sensor domain-containing protein